MSSISGRWTPAAMADPFYILRDVVDMAGQKEEEGRTDEVSEK